MPFQSKAQHKKFRVMEAKGQLPKGTSSRWARHTAAINKLPEHVPTKAANLLLSQIMPTTTPLLPDTDAFLHHVITTTSLPPAATPKRANAPLLPDAPLEILTTTPASPAIKQAAAAIFSHAWDALRRNGLTPPTGESVSIYRAPIEKGANADTPDTVSRSSDTRNTNPSASAAAATTAPSFLDQLLKVAVVASPLLPSAQPQQAQPSMPQVPSVPTTQPVSQPGAYGAPGGVPMQLNLSAFMAPNQQMGAITQPLANMNSVQPSNGGPGQKATALPGKPGHAATNMIDRLGGLDATGQTVDGNNAAGIAKAAMNDWYANGGKDWFCGACRHGFDGKKSTCPKCDGECDRKKVKRAGLISIEELHEHAEHALREAEAKRNLTPGSLTAETLLNMIAKEQDAAFGEKAAGWKADGAEQWLCGACWKYFEGKKSTCPKCGSECNRKKDPKPAYEMGQRTKAAKAEHEPAQRVGRKWGEGDPRFGSKCPHCGGRNTIGARAAETHPDGRFSHANAACNDCNNGFSFNVDTGETSSHFAEKKAGLIENERDYLAAVRSAAKETDTNPTEAQKQAGNYKKGRFRWKGLTLVIENPKGSTRSGVSKAGVKWSITMKDHYGYIAGAVSEADADHVDIFFCEDNPDSDVVFVVNQRTPNDSFDEHKVVCGCDSQEQAEKVYLRNYSSDWTGMGPIRAISIGDFKVWLQEFDTSKEFKDGYIMWPENRKKKAGSTVTAEELLFKVAQFPATPPGFNPSGHPALQPPRQMNTPFPSLPFKPQNGGMFGLGSPPQRLPELPRPAYQPPRQVPVPGTPPESGAVQPNPHALPDPGNRTWENVLPPQRAPNFGGAQVWPAFGRDVNQANRFYDSIARGEANPAGGNVFMANIHGLPEALDTQAFRTVDALRPRATDSPAEAFRNQFVPTALQQVQENTYRHFQPPLRANAAPRWPATEQARSEVEDVAAGLAGLRRSNRLDDIPIGSMAASALQSTEIGRLAAEHALSTQLPAQLAGATQTGLASVLGSLAGNRAGSEDLMPRANRVGAFSPTANGSAPPVPTPDRAHPGFSQMYQSPAMTDGAINALWRDAQSRGYFHPQTQADALNVYPSLTAAARTMSPPPEAPPLPGAFSGPRQPVYRAYRKGLTSDVIDSLLFGRNNQTTPPASVRGGTGPVLPSVSGDAPPPMEAKPLVTSFPKESILYKWAVVAPPHVPDLLGLQQPQDPNAPPPAPGAGSPPPSGAAAPGTPPAASAPAGAAAPAQPAQPQQPMTPQAPAGAPSPGGGGQPPPIDPQTYINQLAQARGGSYVPTPPNPKVA